MNKSPHLPLQRIVDYCDRQLRTYAIEDWPGAANGLQVENQRGVSRLAAAVDASLVTVRMAIDAYARAAETSPAPPRGRRHRVEHAEDIL